jgi:hypothetical protein
MKRIDFLKKLIPLFGATALPSSTINAIANMPIAAKPTEKIYLSEYFIRGFQYYKGPELLQELLLKPEVKLIREPKNEYDFFATAVYFREHKIGFLPMGQNEVIARLLDANCINIYCELVAVNPKVSSWENVFIAVYILKEIDNKKPAKPYLKQVLKPTYTTVNYRNKQIKVFEPQQHIIKNPEFKKALLSSGFATQMPILAHSSWTSISQMDKAAKDFKIVINQYRTPTTLRDTLLSINDHLIGFEQAFEMDGYVAANIENLAKKANEIDGFVKLVSKSGDIFYEVLFKNK